mmetsp:Transcript_4710/g.12069  ORF Transcript_4710/g.12069 Transcript_4710/m.12069 type:complete len:373 (-) Transcript_4710:1162-2280(-)
MAHQPRRTRSDLNVIKILARKIRCEGCDHFANFSWCQVQRRGANGERSYRVLYTGCNALDFFVRHVLDTESLGHTPTRRHLPEVKLGTIQLYQLQGTCDDGGEKIEVDHSRRVSERDSVHAVIKRSTNTWNIDQIDARGITVAVGSCRSVAYCYPRSVHWVNTSRPWMDVNSAYIRRKYKSKLNRFCANGLKHHLTSHRIADSHGCKLNARTREAQGRHHNRADAVDLVLSRGSRPGTREGKFEWAFHIVVIILWCRTYDVQSTGFARKKRAHTVARFDRNVLRCAHKAKLLRNRQVVVNGDWGCYALGHGHSAEIELTVREFELRIDDYGKHCNFGGRHLALNTDFKIGLKLALIISAKQQLGCRLECHIR